MLLVSTIFSIPIQNAVINQWLDWVIFSKLFVIVWLILNVKMFAWQKFKKKDGERRWCLILLQKVIGSHCNKYRSHSDPWLDRRKEKNGRCQSRSEIHSSTSWFFFFDVHIILKNLLQILFSSKTAANFCQDCSNYTFFCSQLFFNNLTGIYSIRKTLLRHNYGLWKTKTGPRHNNDYVWNV